MESSKKISPARRTRDPDAKRAMLQSTALKLFTEKGYENVSIAQIAKASGIAVGTVYRFYENKNSMLRAMLEHIEDLFVQRMLLDWDKDLSYAERIDHICQGLFFVAKENKSLLQLLTMTTDVVYDDGAFPGDRIQSLIREFFAEGISESALVDGDIHMMAAMAHGLVEGAIMRAMRADHTTLAAAEAQLSRVMQNAFLAVNQKRSLEN